MRKKNILLVAILGMLLLIPLNVKAKAIINWTCGKLNLSAGQSTTCTIYLNSKGINNLNTFKAKVSATENISIISIKPAENFAGSTENNYINFTANNLSAGDYKVLTIEMTNNTGGEWNLYIDDFQYGNINDRLATINQKLDIASTGISAGNISANENPKTAISIPYLIIGVGFISVIVLYTLSKKKNKLIKI